MGEFTINGAHNLVISKIIQLPKEPVFLPLGAAEITQINSDYANCIFQELKIDSFSIWLSDYHLKQDATMYGAADQPVLELQIVLEQGMEYLLQGLGKVVMPSLSFNLCYEPYIENKVFLRKNSRLLTFDIHLTLDYLQSRCAYFPLLDAFIKDVTNRRFSMLKTKPLPLSAEMTYLIHSVIHSPFLPGTQPLFVQAQIDQLVMLALWNLTGNMQDTDKLSATDIECLEAVKNYLVMNPDNELTIPQLARKFAINEFKLKKYFKRRFGRGVHEFTIHERMSKACDLLRQRNLSIADVAYTTGYKTPGSFSNQFKKEFFIGPSKFRKR